MSNTKSVEQQLKEAIEASKQTLALSEQVTGLVAEKQAISKRLAEIESAMLNPKASEAVAVDPLVIEKLGELLAERDATNAAVRALTARVVNLSKQASKKADLNEYVEQQLESGEEGNSPAEKQHMDAGKKGKMPQFIQDKIDKREEEESEAEDCAPMKGKKGKAKAEMPDFIKEKIKEREESEAEDCEDDKVSKKAKKASYGEDMGLTEEEMEMIVEHRQARKARSKADSNIKSPLKEEKKDFGDIIPQPGLDPNKNNVNEDNTTHPSLSKMAKKASTKNCETDVEEIMESTDRQESEGENHEHEKTLSTPAPGAKKGKKASDELPSEIPAALMEYLRNIVDEEKKGKKAKNSVGGMNKNDIAGTEDNDGEVSKMKGKDCANDSTKVHEEGCAPTDGNTTEVGDLAPLAKNALDSVVEGAVTRLANVSKAKKEVEEALIASGTALASETKAKDEAYAAVAQLQAKFEALMGKFSKAEVVENALEAKAAKIVSATASEPVGADIQGADAPKTDQDYLRAFEAITDLREQNRYFKANAGAISRAAQTNLKSRRS